MASIIYSTKLPGGTDLVLLEPFLEQLLASLLQNRTAQLQRLVLVELTLIQ